MKKYMITNKREFLLKFSLIVLILFISIFFVSGIILAADTTTTQEVYQGLSTDVIKLIGEGTVNNAEGFIWGIIRYIGWLIVSLLGELINILSEVFYKISFLDFTTNSFINNWYEIGKYVSAGIATVAFLYALVKGFFVNTEETKASSMIKKVLVISFAIVVIPTFFTTATNTTETLIKGINNEAGVGSFNSVGTNIIAQNTIDVVSSVQNRKVTTLDDKLSLSSNNEVFMPILFDINKKVDAKSQFPKVENASEFENPLKYKILSTKTTNNNDGTTSTSAEGQELSYGKLTINIFGTNEELWRYRYNFFPIIILEIATLFVFVINSLRVGKAVWQRGIMFAASPFVFATDVQGKGRVKGLFEMIFNSFLMILFTSIMMVFFIKVGQDLLGTTYEAQGQFLYLAKTGMSAVSFYVLKIILFIGLVFFTLDGAEMFVRLYGVDGGMQDGLTMAKLGLFSGASRLVGKAGKGLGKAVGKAGGAALTGGLMAGAYGAGTLSGRFNKEDAVNKGEVDGSSAYKEEKAAGVRTKSNISYGEAKEKSSPYSFSNVSNNNVEESNVKSSKRSSLRNEDFKSSFNKGKNDYLDKEHTKGFMHGYNSQNNYEKKRASSIQDQLKRNSYDKYESKKIKPLNFNEKLESKTNSNTYFNVSTKKNKNKEEK